MTDSPDGGPIPAAPSHRAPFLSQGGYLPALYTSPDKDEYLQPAPEDPELLRRRQVVQERMDTLADTPCSRR